MPCCGYALSRRDWMWSTALGSFGAMLAGCARTGADNPARADASTRADATASDSSLAAANTLLRDNVAIDVHTHAGANGITSRTARPTDDLARQMRAGRIAVLCLADVPDAPILGRNAQNVLSVVRTPEPGFLYAYHLDRLAWVDELVANHGIRRVLTVADVRAAHAAGQPAIIVDIEGLDFLERKLERLEESYRRGVRTMQLVHYTPNDIGDFQTGTVVHNGLTPFGADVIRACHRLGMVVDVAHATADTVKQAVRVATKPLLLSHTALRGSKAQGETPLTERQITPDHARAVAETGGSIGIWHFFPTLDRYVDGLKEMSDIVGVDHVSVGTDAGGTPGLFPQYGHFAQLVEAMLRGGFTRADAAKIVGGNYLRIFAASVG
jgi:membrane dipeptidase